MERPNRKDHVQRKLKSSSAENLQETSTLVTKKRIRKEYDEYLQSKYPKMEIIPTSKEENKGITSI